MHSLIGIWITEKPKWPVEYLQSYNVTAHLVQRYDLCYIRNTAVERKYYSTFSWQLTDLLTTNLLTWLFCFVCIHTKQNCTLPLFADMITVFQLLHSGIDMDPTVFFTPPSSDITRGHPWKLAKPRAVSRVRRQAFSCRVINDWNGLPLEVVSATSVNQSKGRFNAHWEQFHFAIHPQDWGSDIRKWARQDRILMAKRPSQFRNFK